MYAGAQAGRTSLLPNTDYQLRVRFRDDAGSVSSYAVRNFRTGADSVTFPMEVEDVAASPAPTWRVAGASTNVVLPNSEPNKSSLALQSAAGAPLLTITALNGSSNTVANPPTLGQHADVRVVNCRGVGRADSERNGPDVHRRRRGHPQYCVAGDRFNRQRTARPLGLSQWLDLLSQRWV